jgi:hypothetical protein
MMTYKGDPIAEKLDQLAESTGVPRLQRRLVAADPVRFRWLPILLLALAVVAMGVQIARPNGLGFMLLMVPWSVTILMYQFGPLGSPRQRGRRYDEREAAVVRHGHFVGLMWTLSLAILASLAFGLGKMGAMIRLWDIWTPTSGLDWMAVTFFLLSLEINIAILAASSATPEPLEDEEE